MKRVLLLAVVFATATTHAQITVTSQWIATLGDTVIMSKDTVHASLLDLGSAAGNQSWDFTVLEEHEPDGAILEDPSTAPFSANFPTATFVINDLTDDSVHLFFRQTSTYLDIVGKVEYDSVGQPALPEFIPQLRYMQFPAGMDSSFMSSTYVGLQVDYLGLDPDSLGPHPTIDSLRTKYYFQSFSEIDAWGEVALPQGTFLAVRQHVWNRLKLSSDFYGNGTWQPFTPFMLNFLDSVRYDTAAEATYRWWSDNPAASFWLIEVETDSNGAPVSPVSYLKAEPEPYVGIAEAGQFGFELYPNPCTTSLTVEASTPASWRIDLYDVQARKVLSHLLTGSKASLDVSTLVPGTYLVQVRDETGRTRRLEKIQVAH